MRRPQGCPRRHRPLPGQSLVLPDAAGGLPGWCVVASHRRVPLPQLRPRWPVHRSHLAGQPGREGKVRVAARRPPVPLSQRVLLLAALLCGGGLRAVQRRLELRLPPGGPLPLGLQLQLRLLCPPQQRLLPREDSLGEGPLAQAELVLACFGGALVPLVDRLLPSALSRVGPRLCGHRALHDQRKRLRGLLSRCRPISRRHGRPRQVEPGDVLVEHANNPGRPDVRPCPSKENQWTRTPQAR
mmetsp:Transcript_45718/g.152527  ORF Transcript_45718/g.152527 Transcript_45718/m.152527 type:complete len:242 (-) Transcript_45718:2-727(-)